jgi:hypothetical protein
MSDIDIIKDLLINESGIDVNEKTRKREVIEMRSLFFNIVRTLKPKTSYNTIGRNVNVNHATVLHSLYMFDVYVKYNKELNDLKLRVIMRYDKERSFYSILTIGAEIERLEQRLLELKEHKNNLEKDKEIFCSVN